MTHHHEFMPINSKTTKQEVINYAKRLEGSLKAYREGYVNDVPQWFGVAYIGWGTWEEDVYFVEVDSPIEAIKEFEKAVESGEFIGHGADNERDRKWIIGDEDRVLVYNVVEIGDYRRVVEHRWEKT